MLRNLAALHHLTGEPHYLARAQSIHKAFAAEATSNPFGYATLLHSFTVLADPVQIVMSGKGRDLSPMSASAASIAAAGPNAIIQWIERSRRCCLRIIRPSQIGRRRFARLSLPRPGLRSARGNVAEVERPETAWP